MTRSWGRALAWARWTVAALVGSAFLSVLIANWRDVQSYGAKLQLVWLVAAAIVAAIYLLANAFIWKAILERLGDRLDWRSALGVWFPSQAMRYLPGKVWHILGRVYLSEQRGVRRSSAIVSSGLDLALGLLTSVAVGGAAVGVFSGAAAPVPLPFLPLLTLAGLLLLHPRVLERIANLAARRLDRGTVSFGIQSKGILSLAGAYVGLWVVYGLANLLVVTAIGPLPGQEVVGVAGAFVLAWGLGTVVPFAPSGLGVREGVLTAMLSLIMPVGAAALVAVLARLVFTAAEACCLAAALVLARSQRVAARREA